MELAALLLSASCCSPVSLCRVWAHHKPASLTVQGTAAYAVERLIKAMKVAVSYRIRQARAGQAVPKHSSQQLYEILRVRPRQPLLPCLCPGVPACLSIQQHLLLDTYRACPFCTLVPLRLLIKVLCPGFKQQPSQSGKWCAGHFAPMT